MLAWIRGLLASPVFEGDEEKTRTASVLNTLLMSGLLLLAVAVVSVPFLIVQQVEAVMLMAIVFLLMVISKALMHRGQVRPAGMLYVSGMWALFAGFVFISGGVLSSFTVFYVAIAVIGGVLLGPRMALFFAIASSVAVLGMVMLENTGNLPPSFFPQPGPARWFMLTFTLLMVIVPLSLTLSLLREALGQARGYAAELEEQREGLEKTVVERTQDLTRRTRYLEATTAIARDTASVLDLQALLGRVVNLVSEQFDFYHTGIFLLDPGGEWAVLQAASSEGGRRMLARNHRLQPGMGIVGYVVERGEARIALDVGEDASFFDNPDLSNTRSEMALPLRARGEIIGALDVQSIQPDAFGDEDVTVLQTLADQVAMAISNARLFEQAQESVAAERRAYGELSRDAWQELLRAEPDLGFLSRRQETVPAGDLWRTEMKEAIDQGETRLGDGDSRTVAIPIKVSDQVVGVVDGRKPDGSGEWSPEEIELLEAFTDQLNVALEGARLYQDSQRRAVQEQLVGEVTARMRATLDVENVLKTAVDEISGALGLAALDLRLGTEPDSDNGGSTSQLKE